MKYKDVIKNCINEYVRTYPEARFIGYNTVKGSRMYGTLNDVPVEKCIESPVSENLMMGMAFGMALEGYRPVVCFERHDFLLLGLDALVNHIDKLPWMSGDQFKLPIIVRAIVGGTKPIDPGPQHTQNYEKALQKMLHYTPININVAFGFGDVGLTKSGAVVVSEYKDLYETEV
jgi:pyruvate/2-oxoglutarate/acetoin dehydrogenase E1 component